MFQRTLGGVSNKDIFDCKWCQRKIWISSNDNITAGHKVIEIYDKFIWSEAGDNNKPDNVFQKVKEYCNPRKHKVVESHRFWSVFYQNAQGFEQMFTEIRKRAESCNFAENECMMRDKIVFSVVGKVQELLLQEEHLDVKKCIQICSQTNIPRK